MNTNLHTIFIKEKINIDYIKCAIDELFLKKNNNADFVITNKLNHYEIGFLDDDFEYQKIVFNNYDDFADICFYLLNKHNQVFSSKKNSPRI